MPAPAPGGQLSSRSRRQFSADEYARRHADIEALAGQRAVDAVVAYGVNGSGAAVQYLTGFTPHRDTYACFPRGGAPSVFVQLYNHVPTAREMSVVERVEWGGPDSPAAVATELSQLTGLRRVGVIGSLPARHADRLRELLPGVELVDLSGDFTRGRLVKSEEEIACTRRAAALTDAAMLAFAGACRPGASEYDLGSAFEVAVRQGGGSPGICFLMSRPMTGSGPCVPAQHWSDRVLEAGDMVVVEMSAGYGGYTAQALRTITVDAPPTAEVDALHEVATAAFGAIAARIGPGARAADLLDAAGLIDAAGYSVYDDVVHGYVGGYLPPVLRTPATQHQPYQNVELVPGMFLVVQPNVVTADHSLGVQIGELVLVTDDGYETMHRLPAGILRGGSPL